LFSISSSLSNHCSFTLLNSIPLGFLLSSFDCLSFLLSSSFCLSISLTLSFLTSFVIIFLCYLFFDKLLSDHSLNFFLLLGLNSFKVFHFLLDHGALGHFLSLIKTSFASTVRTRSIKVVHSLTNRSPAARTLNIILAARFACASVESIHK